MNINLTLLFQVLFFALFVWFTKRYVWTPVISILNQRRATIADGLAAADKGRQAEEVGRRQAQEVIDEAKTQAAEIIRRAEKRGTEIVDTAKGDARSEGERLIRAAEAEVEQQVNHARESLRTEVATLAVAGAAQILRREVDEKAHEEMLVGLTERL